jgi:type III secretory pathway component EscT
MKFDWFIVLEVFYLISAVLCAVSVPLEYAHKVQGARSYRTPLRYNMTYGHIAIGFMIGIIPLANTIWAVASVGYFISNAIDRLDGISIFKEKKNEDD